MSEKEWTQTIKNTLENTIKCKYQNVCCSTMWEIRLLILVRTELYNNISNLQHSSVKTGVANQLGNKGAVGISFEFSNTPMCFVNCHLASGDEKTSRRNENMRDILKGLSLGSNYLKSKSKPNSIDISHRFTHLFVLGDLNYRLIGDDGPRIIEKIKSENERENPDYSGLLRLDQLGISKAKKEMFCEFKEERITFPPTYRFSKSSTDEYVWQKQKATKVRFNVPSWCDRVLWRSYPSAYVKNTTYGMVPTILKSDHKPVFSTFNISVIGQFVPSTKTFDEGHASIDFLQIIVKFNMVTNDNFIVTFFSTCLEKPVSTKKNDRFINCQSDDEPNAWTKCPYWDNMQIPKIQPIIGDSAYLEDQHILVAVKSADQMESYGECVIPLKKRFCVATRNEAVLTHAGEEMGRLEYELYVKTPNASLSERTKKLYEMVSTDDEHSFGESSVVNPAPVHKFRPPADLTSSIANRPQPGTSTEPLYSVVRKNNKFRPPVDLQSSAKNRPPATNRSATNRSATNRSEVDPFSWAKPYSSPTRSEVVPVKKMPPVKPPRGPKKEHANLVHPDIPPVRHRKYETDGKNRATKTQSNVYEETEI